MAGQTFQDRLTAARHIITGQSLAKSVCKATTEEIIGPKKKHLDYLIHCIQEPNVSVPELCNMLIERTQQSSWVVVFKALITAHHLMCYGSEKFVQCMATTSCTFHLSTFVDKTATQGYDMSTFVRRYAKYLNSKASTYRTMGADFCKMKRGKEEGVLRNMSTESLLKTLPVVHEQLDALIEFDCSPDDLSNGVMNSCFMLLYRDLIQLFAAYNDGIINLFDKYFSMNKKHCKEALDIYKKFIIAMDKVSDFLKVAESVGIDKGNIPDLTKAPASLLEEMESHLTFLEGKKGHSSAREIKIQNTVPAFESTSTAFSASIDSSHELNGLTVDESVRRAVEEEAAIMNQLKCDDPSLPSTLGNEMEQRMKEIASVINKKDGLFSGDTVGTSIKHATSAPASSVPSPIPPPSSSSTISPTAKQKHTHTSSLSVAGEDLITMANLTHNGNLTMNITQPLQQVPFNQVTCGGNTVSTNFVSEASFKTAFNAPVAPESSSSFDVFGEVLKPKSTVSPTSSSPVPEHYESKSPPPGSTKLISSDLDSSLQTLVQNLDINGPKKPLKSVGHLWGSPKPATRTGGANWSPSSATMTNWGAPQTVQPVVNVPIGTVPIMNVPVMNVPAPYGYQPVPPGMMAQMPYRMPPTWHSTPAAFGVAPQQMGLYTTSSPQHSTIQSGNPTGESSSHDPFGAL